MFKLDGYKIYYTNNQTGGHNLKSVWRQPWRLQNTDTESKCDFMTTHNIPCASVRSNSCNVYNTEQQNMDHMNCVNTHMKPVFLAVDGAKTTDFTSILIDDWTPAMNMQVCR